MILFGAPQNYADRMIDVFALKAKLANERMLATPAIRSTKAPLTGPKPAVGTTA